MSGAEPDPRVLTPAESSTISTIAQELTAANAEYMQAHPELQSIIAEFVQSVLASKPANVVEYARDYFHRRLASVGRE
jgi:hypothetical protein